MLQNDPTGQNQQKDTSPSKLCKIYLKGNWRAEHENIANPKIILYETGVSSSVDVFSTPPGAKSRAHRRRVEGGTRWVVKWFCAYVGNLLSRGRRLSRGISQGEDGRFSRERSCVPEGKDSYHFRMDIDWLKLFVSNWRVHCYGPLAKCETLMAEMEMKRIYCHPYSL